MKNQATLKQRIVTPGTNMPSAAVDLKRYKITVHRELEIPYSIFTSDEAALSVIVSCGGGEFDAAFVWRKHACLG